MEGTKKGGSHWQLKPRHDAMENKTVKGPTLGSSGNSRGHYKHKTKGTSSSTSAQFHITPESNGIPNKAEKRQGPNKNNNGQVPGHADLPQRILRHIHCHRVTFLQGEPGCGKSTAVPQLILDDASPRGRGGSVRVIVAQPKHIAAISLARFVAKLRGRPLGEDVGYCVRHDSATTPTTRLTYVTTGYLLEWLGHNGHMKQRGITHIFLDEVHVRHVQQDLLSLLLKLLMSGLGGASSLKTTKLIIMSATMEIGPLQEYFRCLLGAGSDQQVLDPIYVGSGRFPIEVIHIDEMLQFLPGLPKPVADVVKRLVEASGTGKRALDGTSLPRYVVDLITGLVRHVGRAGDTILVFVASFTDIMELQQGFERSARDNPLPMDLGFLHSFQTNEEQEMVIKPAPARLLKVILTTNIAESSLTVPNVRVVIDIGHEQQQKYDNVNACSTLSRVWCSKASSRQRAGRAGRLSSGVVFRLFTQQTFDNFEEHEKPDVALQDLASTILRVKSLFTCFPAFSVRELIGQLLDSPAPEDVETSMINLHAIGAITDISSDCELTLFGRLATQLSPDVALGRLVFFGLLMGCAVDCVVMAAGMSLNSDDIFHQPLGNYSFTDPVDLQNRRINNARARMRFDGGYYSELLVFREVYFEWIRVCTTKKSTLDYIQKSELQHSRFNQFLLLVRKYAQKTLRFLTQEIDHWCPDKELNKLAVLASVDHDFRIFMDRIHCIKVFCKDVSILQIAIAGAFSKNMLVGLSPKTAPASEEMREFREANMPAHLSFKLRDVPANLAGGDLPTLEKALKVLAPFDKVVPLDERAVLVQCQLRDGRAACSRGIIGDLPNMARIASYMAKTFFRRGDLVFYSKDSSPNSKVEELYVGRPSGSRTIKWTTKMIGKEEQQRVAFNRLSIIPRAIETRKDVPFHIAVAVNLLCSPGCSGVIASLVTVLPQHNMLSVLAILMFRSPVTKEDLRIRLHSKTDRVYSIRYRSTVLELAPRFIRLQILEYVDQFRSKIHAFMTGKALEHGNLEEDLVQLQRHMQVHSGDAAVLAPEIGPWLEYPSLLPVQEKYPKRGSQLSKQQQPNPVYPETSLNTESPERSRKPQSSPVLVQSPMLVQSKGVETFLNKQFYNPSHMTKPGSGHVQSSLEEAFGALDLQVNKRQLTQWLQGDKSHNGMYFSLLKMLVERSGDVEHLKERRKSVLEYVYTCRHVLINKKQMVELEGWYHSFCNPDPVDSTSRCIIGKKSGETIEIHTHGPQANGKAVESLTPENAKDSAFTRKVELNRHQRSLLISALQHQKSAAKITIGPLSTHRKTGLATVSGKPDDVERALQLISNIINVQHSTNWDCYDTYLDSNNMEQKVQFVEPHVEEEKGYTLAEPNCKKVEFMLVKAKSGKAVRDNHSDEGGSLYHANMKDVFDKALGRLGPRDKAQLQARLGRVIFGCPLAMTRYLPFVDSQPVGKLRPALDRHQIYKRRFNDSIPEEDFFYLRACLHLCHPKATERNQKLIILVSNPTAEHLGDKEEKLVIVDAPEAPGKFLLRGVEKKRRLAAIDIVRINAGAIVADVRLSMQVKEEHMVSDEARDYVSNISRRGSKLEFPKGPYVVELERHKEYECFQFEGVKVTLTVVKQIRRTFCQIKYEVEFESTGLDSCSRDGQWQQEVEVPVSAITSRIPMILQQVQSVCSQMCGIGPSDTATGVAQALLRSWRHEHKEARIREILDSELLPASPKGNVKDNEDQMSLRICSIVEMLCHSDSNILKERMNVACELQLVLLRTIRSMTISLSKTVEGRVKSFLTTHEMEPENALHYACLIKCHCSSLGWDWNTVLQPYIMQLILEQRVDAFKEFSCHLNLHSEFFDSSSAQLLDAIMRSSPRTTFSALAKIFQAQSTSSFLKLFNLIVRNVEAIGPPMRLVRQFVGDLLSYHNRMAVSFVYSCIEWTVDCQPSIIDKETHMESIFWLLEMIQTLDLFVDENCHAQVLSLLLRLPASLGRKKELEEMIIDIYRVDETQFRNLHYQNILQSLGCLQDAHKKELRRRGLSESQCSDFNFRSWTAGKIRGRDLTSSSLIPGVNKGGDRLVGSRGIFIPARDPSGQIIGGQLKTDDPDRGKYVWISSNKVFEGGKGPQIEGEMPLFCCVPKEIATPIVGFCEGGLKAHVLAALSGLPVIGASGGDFSKAKHLLESYLATMEVEQIVFFPDAGSQSNDQVVLSYFRTFRLLRDWNYHVRIAWWGQVNKEEHDDIDDYLVKNSSTTDFLLISSSEFWELVDPAVREKLGSVFPEYKTAQVAEDAKLEIFIDDDQIQIVKMPNLPYSAQKSAFNSYEIIIPKPVMVNMPDAPNAYVTPPSVPNFTIEVVMVEMDDLDGVNAAIEWLLAQCQSLTILGLDCEHGFDGDLNLLQLSTHQRCVLIRIKSGSAPHPPRLATILRSKNIVKTGAEVQNDALALYSSLGLMVNGFKNVSHAYKTPKRTMGMLEIFRNLCDWEWTKKRVISQSDWSLAALSLEQVKYAALDAWASRMIALKGLPALERIPVTSLEDLPEQVLDLFARALRISAALTRKSKTIFETSGSTVESSSGSTLRLLQNSFRSRVIGIHSSVELRFKDGQESEVFRAKSRTGKSVVLTPMSKEKGPSSKGSLPINISSISSIIVDNSKHRNAQDQRLREAFYELLCDPDRCPKQLCRALGREMTSSTVEMRSALPKRHFQLITNPFEAVFCALNESQQEALHEILTSHLSATIGPPGTGKTKLIAAFAKAWLHARDQKEILLCTTYQNVAARNLAEALCAENVEGVLLLVSEDYFVDWNESLYQKLARSVVVTQSVDEISGALEHWRRTNKRSAVPIVVCTLALVGSQAFESSLMGGKVTAMVIDECSQAAEGSCIYPLMCLPDLAVVTVLGDPKQLPPFGSSNVQKVPSIFDLVSKSCEVKFLKEQYRMPPIICDFLSPEFYEGMLETAPPRRREKDWQYPLLWVDVQGVSTNDPGNPSKYNLAEAEAITHFCQRLMEHSSEKEVVVLTLYEEQTRRITRLLAEKSLHEKVNVHNVDSFQGQQSEVVLISLVAGHRFSQFAAERHRACVMLSRVRRFLCMFGNHGVVKCNAEAQMWRSLAGFCEARGLVASNQAAECMLSANLAGDASQEDRKPVTTATQQQPL